jgi:hypothetical protein
MEPLEDDGVIILQKPVHQLVAAAAHHHIRQAVEQLVFAGVPLIEMHGLTDLAQFNGACAPVLEAVQMDPYTDVVQRFGLVVHVDDPAIVGRPGDIETDDM